jgi:hypothetical protein
MAPEPWLHRWSMPAVKQPISMCLENGHSSKKQAGDIKRIDIRGFVWSGSPAFGHLSGGLPASHFIESNRARASDCSWRLSNDRAANLNQFFTSSTFVAVFTPPLSV